MLSLVNVFHRKCGFYRKKLFFLQSAVLLKTLWRLVGNKFKYIPLMNWLRMIQECFAASVPQYQSSHIADVKVCLSFILYLCVSRGKRKDCCENQPHSRKICQTQTGERRLLFFYWFDQCVSMFVCIQRISKSWSIKSYFKKLLLS